MDGGFDVDCPRTPDGGDDPGSAANHPTPNPNRPPRPTAGASARARGPRDSRTPRAGTSRKAPIFSPKGARKRPTSIGLEPEECTVPASLSPRPSPPAEPPGIEVGVVLRSNPLGSPPPVRPRGRAHSTDAFGGGTTNPFDDESIQGGDDGVAVDRARSGSGSWWREEIVDEGDGKGEAMDEYYGLNARQKHDLYGGPPPPPPPSSNAVGGTNPFDPEEGAPIPTREGPVSIHSVNSTLDSDIYQQAAAGRNGGHYTTATGTPGGAPFVAPMNNRWKVDDYSFSNVNLSSPVETVSPLTANRKTAHVRDTQGDDRLHPDTNIAPRSTNGGEWHPRSPGVTFECFQPQARKRRGYWANLSPRKKMAVGAVWVAFVCVIFGVTISELRKANAPADANPGANADAIPVVTEVGGDGVGDDPVQDVETVGKMQRAPPAPDADPTGFPTPWPDTDEPSAVPTNHPTAHPTARPTNVPTTARPTDVPTTASPVAQGNIGGYQAIHSKAYDGTSHPSKSPTPAPTGTPTVHVQMVQRASSCEDAAGMFLNHLDNEKDCAWLDNGKEGYSDRKDKNCGGRPVEDEDTSQTVVYPTTELGSRCQATCGLYNGCGRSAASPLPQDAEDNGVAQGVAASMNRGRDRQGFFLNHLGTPKDCAWLYNGKEGQTDRKDKNCGTAAYPATELGNMCAKTCTPYNSNGVLGQISVSGMQVMRSYMSSGYSYSISSPSSSTGCIDGEGEYKDHKHALKVCLWLAGEGLEYNASHRQWKNCGTVGHEITELGRECPWSCRAYNKCGS
ncbi:hypothetical protein ACHAXT_001401 [Thalassiosira profunda]